MISNRIWSVPTVDRAAAPGSLTAYFRCGSSQGKPAATVADTVDQDELDRLTAEFITGEIEIFRRAIASRQKNATRTLKKFLDRDDVAWVERDAGATPKTLAAALL